MQAGCVFLPLTTKFYARLYVVLAVNNLADRGSSFSFLLAKVAFTLQLEGRIFPKMLII